MLRIRLACAMEVEQFGPAKETAKVLAGGSKADAIFAARVLQDLAAIEYLSGRKESAEDDRDRAGGPPGAEGQPTGGPAPAAPDFRPLGQGRC